MALKVTRLSRLNKLIGLGATVVGKSIQGAFTAKEVIDTRIAQARAIATTLSELKGASMKLGQMLSIQGEAFLPPEVTEILGRLQQAAPALSGDEMKARLVQEVKENYGLIARFDSEALAAASIGQVHRGTLFTGEEVVFKIQYPGIAQAIDSELSLSKTLIIPLVKSFAKNADINDVVEEVRELLKQEVDYRQEFDYVNFFATQLAGDQRFIVPKTFGRLTTQNVLTLSFEEGMKFSEFIKLDLSQQARNILGLNIYDLLMTEIFDFKTVQTDPNFGNYLFRPANEETKTVLLDFGACRRYSTAFIENYRSFLRAVALDERNRVFEISYAMGILNADESDDAKNLFLDLCRSALAPFIARDDFDFHDVSYIKNLNEKSFQLVRLLKFLPAPKELIFLNRKLGGVYNYCRAMRVRASFRPVLERVLKL